MKYFTLRDNFDIYKLFINNFCSSLFDFARKACYAQGIEQTQRREFLMVKELLRSHSSVRIYDGEPISKEIIEDLIGTAQMVATSHFVQAYSVIWVTDADKRKN